MAAAVRRQEALVPDGKGLHNLAALLAAPRKEVTAAGLLACSARPPPAIPCSIRRTAYQGRLSELAADIDEAEADRDLARAENARTEREFLCASSQPLQDSAGVPVVSATRPRSPKSDHRPDPAHHRPHRPCRPDLGAHLDSSIRTGTSDGW